MRGGTQLGTRKVNTSLEKLPKSSFPAPPPLTTESKARDFRERATSMDSFWIIRGAHTQAGQTDGQHPVPWAPAGGLSRLRRRFVVWPQEYRQACQSATAFITKDGRCFPGQGPLLTATCWEQDGVALAFPPHTGERCLASLKEQPPLLHTEWQLRELGGKRRRSLILQPSG